MKTVSIARQIFSRGVGIGMVVLVCGQVFPAAAQGRSEKLQRYEADRQACLSGQTSQSLDACMKEAKAVLAERPGTNPTVSPEQLQRNVSIRCDALKGDDHTACVARMRGEGTVSGSVAGGGVLRELVVTEVAPASPTGARASQ